MQELIASSILVASLFLLLASGIWVGISLIGVAWLSMMLFAARPAGEAMAITIWGSSTSWSLTALPLFVWMGEILFRTKLSADLFTGLAPWLSRWPGRLLHTNVISCTIFAAVSGSSSATCATVGRMTLPELRGRGYPDHMVIGTLAGAGTLGLMIPPSLVMIVYGVAADVSIVQLFIAGIGPGILLAILMLSYIIIWALLNPNKIPPTQKQYSFMQKLRNSGSLIPVVLLILAILGSIYAGIATATEAASLGVCGALLLSLLQGSLNWQTFVKSLMGATRLYCMIALILTGAAFLTLAMGYTGLPRQLAEWIGSLHLSNFALLSALLLFYIIMGCFLDGISLILLTMKVVLPIVRNAGIDLIWFGIFLVVAIEMSQITPPVGFNLFVIQGMTNKDLFWIARAALPMFFILVFATFLLYEFPQIAMWLPERMK